MAAQPLLIVLFLALSPFLALSQTVIDSTVDYSPPPSSKSLWKPATAITTGDKVIVTPTQDIQRYKCSERDLIVGGDGSATAEQMQAARDILTEMCDKSQWFRYIVSRNRARIWGNAVQLTMGAKKGTYTASWGHSSGWGLIDIATDNINPAGGKQFHHDTFVGIVTHEVCHIAPELEHGEMMDDFVANVLMDMDLKQSLMGATIESRLKQARGA